MPFSHQNFSKTDGIDNFIQRNRMCFCVVWFYWVLCNTNAFGICQHLHWLLYSKQTSRVPKTYLYCYNFNRTKWNKLIKIVSIFRSDQFRFLLFLETSVRSKYCWNIMCSISARQMFFFIYKFFIFAISE